MHENKQLGQKYINKTNMEEHHKGGGGQHVDIINQKYVNIGDIETQIEQKCKQEYLKVKILKTTKAEMRI